MNEGLFAKYAAVIVKRNTEVEEISMFIQKETGATFSQDEIIIDKKVIAFQTSSVKKVLLRKASVQGFLKERGYIVKM